MQNYQLYSTNIYLGGQMRWDIVIENDTDLYIKDFHLSPISDNIPYNKYSKEYLLNYSHQENISSFYKKIEGYFYNTCISPELSHNWPIISDNVNNVKNYDDTYIMGCKRSKYYNLYQKQMEFFVPLWIERLGSPLKFKFSIYNNDIHISTKSLKFTPSNHKYHNKFIKYFNDYIKYLEIGDMNNINHHGNDEVMFIDLSNNISYISGYNIDTHRVDKKFCYGLVENLTNRERPIMETAGLLINQFKDSHTIAKQLFNFCFHFNIDDILSYDIAKILYGKSFNIKVTVEDDESEYEIMDFYSNFEFLNRQYSGFVNESPEIKSPLTSEYLYENNYIDFKTINKFSPQIIHWSLSDNSDYIFNLSDGFAGYNIDNNGDIIYFTGQNGNGSDNSIDNYIKEKNNTGWANMIKVKNINEFTKVYSYYPESQEKYASTLKKGWVNNVKYNAKMSYDVLLIYIDSEYDDEKTKIYNLCENLNEDLYYHIPVSYGANAYIMLVSSNMNYFTQNNVKKCILEYCKKNGPNSILLDLYGFMDSMVPPKCIIFDKSIQPTLADGPTMYTDEIEYIKDNIHRSYIFRYDGAIKPKFVNQNNILYYKQVYTNEEYKNTTYYKYSNTEYPPLYKSIGYYPINNKIIDYQNYSNINNYKPMEYKWYNNSSNIFLRQTINSSIFSERNENNEYLDVDTLIKNYLKKIYNLSDDDKINYIYNLYDIKWNYDYISDNNVNDFKYNLKLTLK